MEIYFQYHLTHILHGEEEKGCHKKGSSKEKGGKKGSEEKGSKEKEIVFFVKRGPCMGSFFCLDAHVIN